MATSTVHPWQGGPTELILHAFQHLHRDSDFDKRMAFLLLDVGVEIALKTYLMLPDEVTGARLAFHERKQAAEGGFHDLIRAVRKACGERLQGVNLSHIQFYHDLRNRLYHEGNGITVPEEKVHDYAELATKLLRSLLDVDLTGDLQAPEKAAAERAKLVELQEVFGAKRETLRDKVQMLKADFAIVLEQTVPGLAMPSFAYQFSTITERYLVGSSSLDEEYGFPYLVRARTDQRRDIEEYFGAIVNLVESRISDASARDALLSIKKFDLGLGNVVSCAMIVYPLVFGGFPTPDDVQYRALEILVPEFEEWCKVMNQVEFLNDLVHAPHTDEALHVRELIEDADKMLHDIDETRLAVTAWISAR